MQPIADTHYELIGDWQALDCAGLIVRVGGRYGFTCWGCDGEQVTYNGMPYAKHGAAMHALGVRKGKRLQAHA